MLECEFPKLFSFIWVQLYMLSGMLVSPAVSQPNIIPSIGEHKRRGFVLVIYHPCIRRVKQSMLKEYWFQALFDLSAFFLNSENS